MHPQKEGKHLLKRLIEMWGFYTDGWEFSCTWEPRERSWRLGAYHCDPLGDGRGGRKVESIVSAVSWEHLHHEAVDGAAEAMYLAVFEVTNAK